MGIYEEESPIPDPVTFQVHPYPLKRRQIPLAKLERFTFISTGPDDPYVYSNMCVQYYMYMYAVLLVHVRSTTCIICELEYFHMVFVVMLNKR